MEIIDTINTADGDTNRLTHDIYHNNANDNVIILTC